MALENTYEEEELSIQREKVVNAIDRIHELSQNARMELQVREKVFKEVLNILNRELSQIEKEVAKEKEKLQ